MEGESTAAERAAPAAGRAATLRRAQWLWGAGALLLLISVWPLFLWARETALRSRAAAQYEVELVDATRLRAGAREIAVTDALPQSCAACPPGRGPAATTVDGRAYSSDTIVPIDPRVPGRRRYGGWISLARVTENRGHAHFLAVIQRLRPSPGGRLAASGEGLVFRLLLVAEDGTVRSESFPYAHRDFPPYRTALADRVAPPGLGMFPEVCRPWIEPVFPWLFPLGTGAAGIVLIAAASRLARRAAPLPPGASPGRRTALARAERHAARRNRR